MAELGSFKFYSILRVKLFLCSNSESLSTNCLEAIRRTVPPVTFHDSNSAHAPGRPPRRLLAAFAAQQSKGPAIAAVESACDATTVLVLLQDALAHLQRAGVVWTGEGARNHPVVHQTETTGWTQRHQFQQCHRGSKSWKKALKLVLGYWSGA